MSSHRAPDGIAALHFGRSTALRLGGLAALYFAQGVPIGLLTVALPAWLAAHGSSAAQVAALIAITGLPWAFKLVAGPLMDRWSFAPMGRRRPWVMAAQGGLTVSMLAFALVTDPVAQLGLLIALGFTANVFAALQDVAVDGMAIDVLPEDERGRANAFMAFGQVLGFSAFGALNGFLLVRGGLDLAALVSAATLTLVFGFITLVRERDGERLLPWSAGEATALAAGAHETSFVGIFADLLKVLLLPMSLLLVGVEFLARAAAGISISVLPVLATQELGYSADDYAYWSGLLGALAAFVGITFGPLIDRHGAPRLLQLGLLGAAACYIAFGLLQMYWASTPFVLIMLAMLQIAVQAFMVAMIATFMGICWTRVAATQFAIYMSLANLSRSVGAGAFALLAVPLGSVGAMYLMGALLVGAALLLVRFDPRAHTARLRSLDVALERESDAIALD